MRIYGFASVFSGETSVKLMSISLQYAYLSPRTICPFLPVASDDVLHVTGIASTAGGMSRTHGGHVRQDDDNADNMASFPRTRGWVEQKAIIYDGDIYS